jgi:hypothetical protein
VIRDLIVGYWPVWLLLVCGLVLAAGVCRAAALGDREMRRSLSEREARLAVRPSPASIDVEPMG